MNVRSLNVTFLVMNRKKGVLEDLKDYRPISLLGLYKILAKVLANMLRSVIGKGCPPLKMPLLRGGKF